MTSFRTLALASLLAALPLSSTRAQAPLPVAVSGSVEYLSPTKANRRIHTVSADVGLTYTFSERRRAAVGLGLTTTTASGHIIQLDDALQSTRLETSAFGVGPSVRLRALPMSLGPMHVGFEASAGLLWYSRRFPAGGDYYNGMLRVGPAVAARLARSTDLHLSAKWTHVSNGQGLGAFNPSYEAWAFAIGAEHRLSVTRPAAASRGRVVWPMLLGGIVGGVGGAVLTRRCEDGACRIGGGITAVGALSGAGISLLVANLHHLRPSHR